MTPAHAVLVIGAGLLQTDLIREAQAMGLYVIATDRNPSAPGMALADECHVLDTYDTTGHAKLAASLREHHACRLRGVVTCGADVAPTCASAAAAADVPGIPIEVAERTHNKVEVRRWLTVADLQCYQPEWLYFHDARADEDHRIGYPCVVKPASQRASRGVSIVQDASTFGAAIQQAQRYGADYLIEEQLTGTEHSAEAILDGEGALLWFNIVDRPFDYSSGTGIEVGHINPTCLDAQKQQQIQLMLLACARALDVTWGPIKLDCMWTADGPRVLEVTARLSGGFDCQRTSPMTGRHPMRQLLQLATGQAVDPQPPAQGYAACAAILPQKHGVVQALPLLADSRCEVIWSVAPGETMHPAQHNGERSGYILTHADDYATAWGVAKAEADRLVDTLEVV